jgi:chromosome segregation ATPase
MAPAKPPPSNVGAKNIATSLSSPVSLLWAHQLRREHSALLARIEDLASAVSNVSLEQLKKIAAQATRVETKMSTIESKQVKLKKELDRAGDREGHLENDVSMVSDRLDISEESILALRKDVHTIEEQLKKDLVVIVERKLQQDNEEQERQVQELKAQIRDIQSRLPEIVSESVVGVRDSMEEIREQMNPIGLSAPLFNSSMMLKY